MKAFRYGLVVMAVALMTFGLIGTAAAFHSGGVAECGGCHSMHSAAVPTSGTGHLLVGATASETCLSCHESDSGSSFHIATADSVLGPGLPPLGRSPGGDFAWLKKDYTFVVRGTTNTEDGQTHGHNIIAGNFGYTVDTDNPTSPGGSYDATELGCASCHDPHGQARRISSDAIVAASDPLAQPIVSSGSYHNSPAPGPSQAVGVYRLLASSFYSAPGGASFNGAPAAIAPSSYSKAEDTLANQVRVSYSNKNTSGHTTWGDWCATCHADMHTSSAPIFVHPVDQVMSGAINTIYDAYRGSGNQTGTSADAFLSLVPFFENASSTYADLQTHSNPAGANYLNGPTATPNAQVSCLSCHRAHASGWEYGLRWNMEGEFITYNGVWPGTDNAAPPQFARGRLEAETQKAYYDRPASTFASYQRVLCNKCHGKD